MNRWLSFLSRITGSLPTALSQVGTKCVAGFLLLSVCVSGLAPHSAEAATPNESRMVAADPSLLPMQNIQQFVTAIGVIERYYVKPISVDKLFDQALTGMVGRLDPHSAYLDKQAVNELKIASSGKFTGIGVELVGDKGVLRVVSPLDGSPAKKAGLESGDLILKVNGVVVRDVDMRQMISKIRGKKGTYVNLTVLAKGEKKPQNIRIKRGDIKLQAVKGHVLAPGYAYLRLAFFQGQAASQLRSKVLELEKQIKAETGHPMRGMVLDLRDNPGGLLSACTEIANSLLMPADKKKHDGLIVYTKGRDESAQIRVRMQPENILHGAPLVVLVNGGSASASEILSGVLQDDKRAVIVGQRSFGKGSVQSVFPLGDEAIKLTTALYYTPAGREIQARGIEPNILVHQLHVDKKAQAALDFDEADFSSHIANNSQKDTVHSKVLEKYSMPQRKDQKSFKLAQKDYQLYQGLVVLQGLYAQQHRSHAAHATL